MSEPYIGSIVMFAGNFAPKGWAFCQGQLMSIAQNTALFSILGTTYGGDGITTFAVPDLRGRVPIQQGQGPGLPPYDLGESAGTPNVTLLVTNMPAHNHLVQASNATSSGEASPQNNFPASASDPITGNAINAYAPTADTTMNPTMVGVAGGNQPFSIMPPYLGINFIIALEGIYPSRN